MRVFDISNISVDLYAWQEFRISMPNNRAAIFASGKGVTMFGLPSAFKETLCNAFAIASP